MTAPEVEEFAKLLITHVRDMAIAELDISLRPSANDVRSKRWRKKLNPEQLNDVSAEIIPDCVDSALFYLLNALDQGLVKMSFTASSGKTVDVTEAGKSEMSGWYAGANGWRARYAKERFNDDFADLA